MSLCKLLCVSSAFTDKHHRLLFKILETSRDPNIRANSVIALGDVAVSFNTIIDENSAELYKGLLDADPRVKKTTLMVLTHLILNGMIKVKGQLGEMAKCVEDEDVRIQDLAKLFFSELSTKENAIYNNLPDSESLLVCSSEVCLTPAVNSHQSPVQRCKRYRGGEIREHHEVYLHIHREGSWLLLFHNLNLTSSL